MKLWVEWMSLVNLLEGAFRRKRTFFWFVLVLFGFSVKFDSFGVTSLARGAGLLPSCYTGMLNFFHSGAVNLLLLRQLWVAVIFWHFSEIVRINNRVLIVGDGIKIPKEGHKMPGVKWLHQSSESNSKAEYIMGHSIQALCVLVRRFSTCFAVPLTAEIHEGIRFHWTDTRTLLDKMLEMLTSLGIPEAYYLVLFVLTRHPVRGDSIVMSTDLCADPVSLIMGYGFRFRIEVFFKMAVHQVGAFLYRFWLKIMAPRKRSSGDQHLQFAAKDLQEKIRRKLDTCHLFMQAAFIAHGLLQYLSIKCHQTVWSGFGTWLRTIRANTLPSEMLVALALSGSYAEFLEDGQHCPIFMKFMREKLCVRQLRHKIPASAEAA